jgi:hypothetical protein
MSDMDESTLRQQITMNLDPDSFRNHDLTISLQMGKAMDESEKLTYLKQMTEQF